MAIIHDESCLDKVKSEQQSFIGIAALSAFPELIHGFTTRYGGVSKGAYSSLNLSFNRPDPVSNVRINYQIISDKLGVPLEKMVLSQQVHDKKILPVDRSHAGMGLIKERSFKDIDGLVTNETGLMLITYYADCVPIYFYDQVNKVIALTHSGWKGTLLNIAGETVKTMEKVYSCRPENIHVALGPHIKACCFEVDQDVADMFINSYDWAKDYSSKHPDGKWVIDLEGIIIGNLINYGIPKVNISGSAVCTKCHKDIFFSHRGGNGNTGTGAAFLMIRGNNV